MFGNKFKPSGRVFVKICGITNQADTRAAVDAGVDALGFNLVSRSKRYIDIEKAAAWIENLPKEICKVAVMADPNWEDVCRVSQLQFIDALQLHGKESPEFCRRLAEAGTAFAKALPVANSKSLTDIRDYSTDTLILDTASGDEFGGTGRAFPWRFARQFGQQNPKLKIILAGGLNPENVATAIKEVRPFGVDVTSGVEVSPGRKDAQRIKAFVQAARQTSDAAA